MQRLLLTMWFFICWGDKTPVITRLAPSDVILDVFLQQPNTPPPPGTTNIVSPVSVVWSLSLVSRALSDHWNKVRLLQLSQCQLRGEQDLRGSLRQLLLPPAGGGEQDNMWGAVWQPTPRLHVLQLGGADWGWGPDKLLLSHQWWSRLSAERPLLQRLSFRHF